MRVFTIVIAALSMMSVGSSCLAAKHVDTGIQIYSHQELESMARSYLRALQDSQTAQNDSEMSALDAMGLSEFKGYLSGYLEFSSDFEDIKEAETLKKCWVRENVNKIAFAAAQSILVVENSRALSPRERVKIAVLVHCMLNDTDRTENVFDQFDEPVQPSAGMFDEFTADLDQYPATQELQDHSGDSSKNTADLNDFNQQAAITKARHVAGLTAGIALISMFTAWFTATMTRKYLLKKRPGLAVATVVSLFLAGMAGGLQLFLHSLDLNEDISSESIQSLVSGAMLTVLISIYLSFSALRKTQGNRKEEML